MSDFRRFFTNIIGDASDGKDFELFCKWFLLNDPVWSSFVKSVWLWDEWPGRWGADNGIDLIFEDKDGCTWAVQSKAYGLHRSVKKADIDTFISESGRAAIDKRLLIASCEVNNKVVKTFAEQEKTALIYSLSDFESSDLSFPNSLDEFSAKPKKVFLDHGSIKKEAIDAAVNGLNKYDRGQLIMACGTGKTFTTLWIKEKLKPKKTLVLLPSLSLLSQTLHEWAKARSDEYSVLNICSDKTVAKGADDLKASQSAFPVTSQIDEIRKHLSSDSPTVVFCTYHSSPLVAEAIKGTGLKFDLTISDEAHRCAGSSKSAFTTALNDALIPSSKRLFVTATPRYFASSVVNAAETRGSPICSMDDPELFGPVLYELPFGKAIDLGLLTDYQVVVVGVDKPMIKEWIDEREIIQIDNKAAGDARSLASKIAVIKAIEDYDIKRMITFHGLVKKAQSFTGEIDTLAEVIPESKVKGKNIYASYVSGAMPAGQRKKEIDALKNLHGFDMGILANARCLSEGVDVPSLDAIAFIDPRRSQVDIIQAVGRAIRKSENKTKGTIIIPVFIENEDEAEFALEDGDYDAIWNVIKALRAHDETLADSIDSYRTALGEKKITRDRVFNDKIYFDLPLNVDSEFTTALSNYVIRQTSDSWEEWFGMLLEYQAKHENIDVPQEFVTDEGMPLGHWAARQRRLYKRKKLLKDREVRLKEIGFNWAPVKDKWPEGFQAFLEFKKEFNHMDIPQKFTTKNGFKLGLWVSNQRSKHKPLSESRRKMLNDEKFPWNGDDYRWELNFSALQKYLSENDHKFPSASYVDKDGIKIGVWVNSQRVKLRDSSLKKPHVRALESIGISANVDEDNWQKAFLELTAYKKKKGNCLVGKEFKTDSGFGLGSWVGAQRQKYKNNKLKEEHISKLESIDFVWNTKDAAWQIGFDELAQYLKSNSKDSLNSKTITSSGYKLGAWLWNQKRFLPDGLTTDKKEKLHSLNIDLEML